ncbi:MAG: adenylate/guanylate cyclase domain-containing protein [Betaproteobacteria bacterium]|nr:adenylate/guanylate cyclase domain-containing protein [Betaproteobacteria bacterium]
MEPETRRAGAGAGRAALPAGPAEGFFSPPQLAESIVNGGGEDLLKTHRREVVVGFLDLRGFTASTDSSEPGEVMGVLGRYHRVMGRLILAHEGTLEHFAGEGILIFFNDPIRGRPAGNAISMALAMQQEFAALARGVEEARLLAGPRHRHRAGLRDARRGRLRGGGGSTRASAASPAWPRATSTTKARAGRS